LTAKASEVELFVQYMPKQCFGSDLSNCKFHKTLTLPSR